MSITQYKCIYTYNSLTICRLYYDEDDTHSDEERLAVATVFGLNWGRRGSVGPAAAGKQQVEQKDRLALDISLLKKQYDRLRERQKQAHVILTTACSTAARQGSGPASSSQPAVPVNQLLLGRPAIVTNKGKRVGAPLGAIPPARKPSLPAVLHTKPTSEKQLRRGETLLWRDTDPSRRRRDSLTWKEIKADRAAMIREGVDVSSVRTQKLRTRFGKSDSSSYSEDSDGEQESGTGGGGGSSTDTSLCDDDDPKSTEKSPKQKAKLARKLKEQKQLAGSRETSLERQRPKSWAPSSHEIPFMLMGTDSGDEKEDKSTKEGPITGDQAEDSATESGHYEFDRELHLVSSKMEPLKLPFDPEFTGMTSVSPIPTPREKSEAEEDLLDERKPFDVSDDGVTNQYFERVNSVERPNRLELTYSLNEEETDTNAIYLEEREKVEGHSGDREYNSLPPFYPRENDDGVQGGGKVPQIRDDNIPGENKDDYKELLSMTIEENTVYKPPTPTASTLSNASRKRRDPRRKTLTRSSTIEIEERYQALERRISQDQPSGDRQAKYIPSTAALEERFNTLEKQLSAEKQRKELSEMEAEYPIKSERIPSTADLESRFNSLTKQMSSSESSSKTPIDLKDEDRPSGSSSKNQKDSEKTSKLHKSEEPESNTKETTGETEASDSNDSKIGEKETEQPRIKKLPSTAELEDRFNALERKMSVQKSSPSKNKKEPPDEEESKSTKEPEEPEESEKANEKTSGRQTPIAKKDSKDSDQKKSETKENQSPTKNQDEKVKVKSPKSEEMIEKETSSNPKEDSHESEAATNKKVEGNRELSSEKGDHKIKEKSEEAPGKAGKETAETKNANVKDSSKKGDSQKNEAAKTSVSQTESDLKPSSKENSTSKDAEQEKTPRKSPPSTEELEKRFNALEKQMSTTNLETTKEPDQTKPATKSQSTSAEVKTQKSMKSFDDKIKEVNVAIEKEQSRVEVEVNAEKKRKNVEEAPKNKEGDSQQPEESQHKGKNQRRASEPPSTEDLEKRYETLKRRMSSKNQFSETVDEALERIQQEVISEAVEEKKPPPSTEDLESRFEALHGDKKNVESKMDETKHVDVAIEAHIPSPPPPPPPPKERPVLAEPVLHQQQALIEELQSKMRGQSPGEENLKPSEINPQRRQKKLLQRPTPMGDETSEAPANTAYYRAANHEQWQQRMVRRFSDLPSRADLENRLQFLERQLYKKFYKQRCASDSEVASRVKLPPEDQPSTSRQARKQEAEGQLEQRVLALEKQLSENSLKLLEAMRERHRSADDSGSPRRLSTETIDATGKELVRYTQNIGELEEVDAHKPINISINIKMMVNKDSESKQPKGESKPTTEDLTRRLEQLEQQLLEERAKNGSIPPENEVLEEKPEKLEEKDSCKKQEKNCHNQHVKGDEVEKTEIPADRKIEPASAKETKTLENVEKAQTRAKVVDTEKSVKDQNAVTDEKSVQDQNVVVDKKADRKILDKKDKSPAAGKSEDTKQTSGKKEKSEDIKQASEAPKAGASKETSTRGKPSETKLEKPTTKESVLKETFPKKENLESEKPKSKENEATKTETQKSKETPTVAVSPKESKVSSKQMTEKKETIKDSSSKELPEKMVINSTDVGPMDPNGKTVVLLMDNEHRASKVRRLTRANTEELEDLFQALEKQLNDRNLVKSEDGRLIRVDPKPSAEQVEQTQAISDLTKEIEDFTSAKPEEENPKEAAKEDKPEPEEPEDFDWGPNTVKHHLKRKTVYLPSTKELESRFRSLERQIKLLEDVEKIDVEQRLNEIERKIKLQYSLSHEKDLNKYLELCEGKGLDDDEPVPVETPTKEAEITTARDRSRSPGRKALATKSPYTSPSRKATIKTPHTSPTRKPIIKSPYTSPSRKSAKSPYTSPSRNRQRSPSPTRSPERKSKKSPYTSPARRKPHPNDLPISDDLEYKYRVLDLVRSKSKENLAKRMNDPNRKPAIHPLEMILSPSPDADAIPTTGELEHRIRVLDEKLKSPAKTRSKSRSRSPTIEDIKRQKMRDEKKPRTPVHNLERIVSSPGRPEPPTAEELEERIRILEQEHKFDFKTQKDYKAFNQKLKDVISPSLSFDEFRAAKSREQSPRRHGPTTPKSALRRDDFDEGYCGGTHTSTLYRPTSPKVIRFRDEDEDEDQFEEAPRPKSRQTSDRMVGTTHDVLDCLTENTKILQRILKKTLADQPSATRSYASSTEGLDALGSRLMRVSAAH